MLFKIPMWVGVLLTGLSTLMLLALQQYGDACRFYMIESGFALTIAFLINVSVISVTGSVCNSLNLNPDDQKNCRDLDLNKASFLLENVLGNWSSKILAIALLASGQSSTITGTYAGQYVMQGFLDLRLKPWIRNFLTRCLAIVPSLIVAIIGGPSGAGQLIIIASNNLEERNGQLQASTSAAEKGLTSENFQKLGESSFVAFFVMLVSLTQMMMVCQIDEQHISMFILF